MDEGSKTNTRPMEKDDTMMNSLTPLTVNGSTGFLAAPYSVSSTFLPNTQGGDHNAQLSSDCASSASHQHVNDLAHPGKDTTTTLRVVLEDEQPVDGLSNVDTITSRPRQFPTSACLHESDIQDSQKPLNVLEKPLGMSMIEYWEILLEMFGQKKHTSGLMHPKMDPKLCCEHATVADVFFHGISDREMDLFWAHLYDTFPNSHNQKMILLNSISVCAISKVLHALCSTQGYAVNPRTHKCKEVTNFGKFKGTNKKLNEFPSKSDILDQSNRSNSEKFSFSSSHSEQLAHFRSALSKTDEDMFDANLRDRNEHSDANPPASKFKTGSTCYMRSHGELHNVKNSKPRESHKRKMTSWLIQNINSALRNPCSNAEQAEHTNSTEESQPKQKRTKGCKLPMLDPFKMEQEGWSNLNLLHTKAQAKVGLSFYAKKSTFLTPKKRGSPHRIQFAENDQIRWYHVSSETSEFWLHRNDPGSMPSNIRQEQHPKSCPPQERKSPTESPCQTTLLMQHDSSFADYSIRKTRPIKELEEDDDLCGFDC